MNKDIMEKFNYEVERYRKALLFYAKQCEWETFKANAGRLFDYLESIEMSEIERKFFRISKVIIFILSLIVIFILKFNPGSSSDYARLKEIIILLAVGGGSFEIYFFCNFRMYMDYKNRFYKKRREKFIREIEKDFKDTDLQAGA